VWRGAQIREGAPKEERSVDGHPKANVVMGSK